MGVISIFILPREVHPILGLGWVRSHPLVVNPLDRQLIIKSTLTLQDDEESLH